MKKNTIIYAYLFIMIPSAKGCPDLSMFVQDPDLPTNLTSIPVVIQGGPTRHMSDFVCSYPAPVQSVMHSHDTTKETVENAITITAPKDCGLLKIFNNPQPNGIKYADYTCHYKGENAANLPITIDTKPHRA